jgi:hypothetical protein
MADSDPPPTNPNEPEGTRRIPGPPVVYNVLPDGTVTATGGGKIGVGRDATEALADLRAKLSDTLPRP